jgi:hypothetical protein
MILCLLGRRHLAAPSLPAAAALALVSCGASETSTPDANPQPILTGITPELLAAGSPGATLTVSGRGFVRSSQVRWNDTDRLTHYQNAQTLTVDLSASDLAVVTTGRLEVVTGPPGGGSTGVAAVTIGYPVPTVTAVTPNSVAVQPPTGSTQITVTGTGFFGFQSAVRFGGVFVTTAPVSSTQLTAIVANTMLSTPITWVVTVVNSSPGGGVSNGVNFSVQSALRSGSILSPGSRFTGTAFALAVNGAGFGSLGRVARALLNVPGQSRSTWP